MKKLALLLGIFMAFGLAVQAQEEAPAAEAEKPPKAWTFGGQGGLTFNQVALFNWAAGGNSNMSLIGNLSVFANYKSPDGKITGENKLMLAYGFLKNDFIRDWKGPITKAEDLIDLTSKWGMRAWSDKFSYAMLLNFRTQFAPGFASPTDSLYLSRFMAPGYLTFGIGIDYKPVDWISFYLSPLSMKATFVTDNRLADAGAFGVNSFNPVTGERRPGAFKNARLEMGAVFRMGLKKDVWKEKVGIETTVELFSNYLDRPGNIDVRWTTGIVAKIHKFLTVNLFTDLIYDNDILIPITDSKGAPVGWDDSQPVSGTNPQKVGPRIQFKEVFGIGFTYKFGAGS